MDESKTVYCPHGYQDVACFCGYCDWCGEYVVSCPHDDPAVREAAIAEDRAWELRNAYRAGVRSAEAQWDRREWQRRSARETARKRRAEGDREGAAYHYGYARHVHDPLRYRVRWSDRVS